MSQPSLAEHRPLSILTARRASTRGRQTALAVHAYSGRRAEISDTRRPRPETDALDHRSATRALRSAAGRRPIRTEHQWPTGSRSRPQVHAARFRHASRRATLSDRPDSARSQRRDEIPSGIIRADDHCSELAIAPQGLASSAASASAVTRPVSRATSFRAHRRTVAEEGSPSPVNPKLLRRHGRVANDCVRVAIRPSLSLCRPAELYHRGSPRRSPDGGRADA